MRRTTHNKEIVGCPRLTARLRRVTAGFAVPLAAILLASCGGKTTQDTASASASAQESGAALYQRNCASCHISAATIAPPLFRDMVQGRENDAKAVIKQGTPNMSGFQYLLNDSQIDAIIDFIKSKPDPIVSVNTDRVNP